MNKKEVTVIAEDREDSRKIVMIRAENVVLSMLHQIAQGRCPGVTYPSGLTETLDHSASYKEKKTQSKEVDEFSDTMANDSKMTRVDFTCKRSRNKLTLMTTVLSHAHRLAINGDVTTRRSLYYDLQSESTEGLAPEQRHVDSSVNHVANLLGCAPWDLGFIATGKGLVAGDLTLGIGSGESVDCSVRGGVVVPQIFSNLTKLQTSSDFVLIVEKDSVFQKLIEQDCPRSLNCILITGKGYPDVSTRMLVRILWEKLNLPVYALVDADPYGLEIMLVYRFGSAALSKEHKLLVCPGVRWLGIHPSELIALGVKATPLSNADRSKLASLEERPHVKDFLSRELDAMKRGKAEIESVASFSLQFLSSAYIPSKIKAGQYL